MSSLRTLLLLRHAEAEATRPGSRDRDRRLSDHGQEQARAVGETIRTAGLSVDHVLCSSAVRTRETLAGLQLPAETAVEFIDSLYDAGTDSIIELIETLPDDAHCVLVVGHAPGVPGVVHELSDASAADPAAWAVVEHRYPPATLTTITLRDWTSLADCRLVAAALHV